MHNWGSADAVHVSGIRLGELLDSFAFHTPGILAFCSVNLTYGKYPFGFASAKGPQADAGSACR